MTSKKWMLVTAAIAAFTSGITGYAHEGRDGGAHHHRDDAGDRAPDVVLAQAEGEARTSGQGAFTFRVLYTGGHLPEEAVAVLKRAHGGFAVDRRDGFGQIYFALPGAGIIRLSADCSSAELLDTPDAMRDTNMHNATIWYDDESPYLVFPANDAGKVFTTTTDGELVHTLGPPKDMTFDVPKVNEYFEGGGRFVPTDVDCLGATYYVTTGYSPLDYVLTARVTTPAFDAAWQGLAFGGRGDGPGQFGTGHGVTIVPDSESLAVADRPRAEIDRFTSKGDYLDTVKLPEGAFPCDIDYVDEYAVVGCLHGPDRDKGAPIYVLEGDEVVSTVMPKEELGLENFQHIHNAVMINRGGRYYIIAQAWNPGDFAVLEQAID